MPTKTYWLLFAAVQVVGAAIALLSLGHPNYVSLIASLLLLLPGDLIASAFGKISPNVFYPVVFLINAGVWFLLKKIVFSREASPQA